MIALPSISVVIPVHNEEQILESTVLEVLGGLRDSGRFVLGELILCENGSRDGTRALAEKLAAAYPEVRVLASDTADYGAAMRAGFQAAGGDFIVNFDADYYDFGFLDAAVALDADIVVASKNIEGSSDARALVRRVGSRGFGWFVRRTLGIRTRETHGIKLYRRGAIAGLMDQVLLNKDLFDTELVARAEWAGLVIVELPITTSEMRHSRSGIVRRIPRTVIGLLRLRRIARDGSRS